MNPNLQSKEKNIIETLIQRFLPQHDSYNIISDSRDKLIEVKKSSSSFILRAIKADNQHGKMTVNETEWITHLHKNGIGVPVLVRSEKDLFVEQAGSGEMLYNGYCYQKVPINFTKEDHWYDPHFIQELGSTVGKMHTLTESFNPSEPENIPSWKSPEWISNPEKYFPKSQKKVIDPILELKDEISKLTKGKRNYGLIHDDLHTGNIFKVDGKIIILDFECLHLNWFIAEIASTLLFRTWIGQDKENHKTKEIAIHFLRDFINGYKKEHNLEDNWQKKIPLFLKLREISLFATLPNTDVKTAENSLFWYVYRSISENKPFIEIDFSKILT